MEFQATLELHGKTATGISVPPEEAARHRRQQRGRQGLKEGAYRN